MSLKEFVTLVKTTFQDWSDDRASQLAAGLAYYAVFSLGPLLVIAIAVAGWVFGEEAARQEIVGRIGEVVGEGAAGTIETMIAGAAESGGGLIATIISVVTLLLAASGVFVSLQTALNMVWEVEPRPGGGIMRTVRQRASAFLLVLGVGVALLVFLFASTAVSALDVLVESLGAGTAVLFQVLNWLLIVALTTLVFAAIYRYVPDAVIAWEDVWVGAVVTAVLMGLGTLGISIYLANASVASTYGAAGSVIVILLWIYYSAQVFLFGAEFTQVYARRHGKEIEPAPNARLTPEARLRRRSERAAEADHPGSIPPPPPSRQPYRPREATP